MVQDGPADDAQNMLWRKCWQVNERRLAAQRSLATNCCVTQWHGSQNV